MPGSYDRMLQLINDFFYNRADDGQITVDEEERALLERIHPATLSEVADEGGPLVWILLIPTTQVTMEQFLSGHITERQLLRQTPIPGVYSAIYLCSAFTLPEARGKGLTRKLAIDAIKLIQQDHPVRALFYWPFSDAGKVLARQVARETGLQLYEKTK